MNDTEEYPPIKFIRLKTGDDLVCEVLEVDDNDKIEYVLLNPYKVIYMPTGAKGYIQIAFMPWVFTRICDKQEFSIRGDDVLLISDVSDYMLKYYWETMDGDDTSEGSVEQKEEPENDLESLKEVFEEMSKSKRTMH